LLFPDVQAGGGEERSSHKTKWRRTMEHQGTTKRSSLIITRAQGLKLSQENIEQALQILKRSIGKPQFATSPVKNALFSTRQILK
jgi:hypothetical protein